MTRNIRFEDVLKMLKYDIPNMEQVLDLAYELVNHVEYWEKAEKSAVKTLTQMLSDARDKLEKSNNMINFCMETAKRTDAMVDARDQKIKELEDHLAECKMLNGGNEE